MYYFKEYVHRYLGRLVDKHRITGSFLEIGCGRGDNLQFLSTRGFRGVGIDVSEAALASARSLLSNTEGIGLARKDVFSVNETFDWILCICVLEHIEDESAALDKLRSLLATDRSHLILGVPGAPYMGDDPLFGHYRRYRKAELVQRLEAHGFTVEECLALGYPFLYYTRIWINHLLRLTPRRNHVDAFAHNTLMSDTRHPYESRLPGKALAAVLDFGPSRWLIHQLLELQRVFEGGSKAHTFVVVATPRSDR